MTTPAENATPSTKAHPLPPMIAGWQKFSTCDYPNHIVATVFLQGCPLHCEFCYNADMQRIPTMSEANSTDTWESIFAHLSSRRGLLDGLILSGGEPLVFGSEAVEVARRVKAMGFKFGIHTTGVYPKVVQSLIDEDLLDWAGLDIKATAKKYPQVSRTKANFFPRMLETLQILDSSGIPYELRTTTHPSFLNKEDLIEIAAFIATSSKQGKWVLQRAQSPDDQSVIYEWNEEIHSLFNSWVEEARTIVDITVR